MNADTVDKLLIIALSFSTLQLMHENAGFRERSENQKEIIESLAKKGEDEEEQRGLRHHDPVIRHFRKTGMKKGKE